MSEKMEAVATSEPRRRWRIQPGREGQRFRVRLRPAGHRPSHRRTGWRNRRRAGSQALKNIKHILDAADRHRTRLPRHHLHEERRRFHEIDDVYAQTFIGSVKRPASRSAATTFRRALSLRSTPSLCSDFSALIANLQKILFQARMRFLTLHASLFCYAISGLR